MIAKSEYKVLKKIVLLILLIGDALSLLKSKQRVINHRRSITTDLKLDREIFLCEARKCKKILKEIS